MIFPDLCLCFVSTNEDKFVRDWLMYSIIFGSCIVSVGTNEEGSVKDLYWDNDFNF